jgi:hypothetical protein
LYARPFGHIKGGLGHGVLNRTTTIPPVIRASFSGFFVFFFFFFVAHETIASVLNGFYHVLFVYRSANYGDCWKQRKRFWTLIPGEK